MFTGIIEEVGEIVALDDGQAFRTIRVGCRVVRQDMQVGSSIAVNGVCLTARSLDGGGFAAELSRETLDRTSLQHLNRGAAVNLERPMSADGRFGGHIVQGHVDGVGRLRAFDRTGDNWVLQVEFPDSGRPYIVGKGSIAVDGISLTVAGVAENVFNVAIIPHTLENTNLKRAQVGDSMNLEFDIIAKYVERMLHTRTSGVGGPVAC
jgi:riboflavin synthase